MGLNGQLKDMFTWRVMATIPYIKRATASEFTNPDDVSVIAFTQELSVQNASMNMNDELTMVQLAGEKLVPVTFKVVT